MTPSASAALARMTPARRVSLVGFTKPMKTRKLTKASLLAMDPVAISVIAFPFPLKKERDRTLHKVQFCVDKRGSNGPFYESRLSHETSVVTALLIFEERDSLPVPLHSIARRKDPCLER